MWPSANGLCRRNLTTSLFSCQGLHTSFHRPCCVPPSWCLHRDHHVGKRLLHHHAQPAHRGGGLEGRTEAWSEIRQNRQTAFHPQQLPDAACVVPDVVEPLPSSLRHTIQLGDCWPGVSDGCHHPPLLQHGSRPRRKSNLDLARHSHPVHHRRMAFHQSEVPDRRSASRHVHTDGTLHDRTRLWTSIDRNPRPLRNVPCKRTNLGRHDRATEECRSGNWWRHRKTGPRGCFASGL